MRLWHIDLLKFLPNKQLLAQKRECDMIAKCHLVHGEKVKSLVIDYVYKYDFFDFFYYYITLQKEFEKRGYNFNKTYLNEIIGRYGYDYEKDYDLSYRPFKEHHDDTYLKICYYNLYEKFLRKQSGFTEEIWKKLDLYVKSKIKI